MKKKLKRSISKIIACVLVSIIILNISPLTSTVSAESKGTDESRGFYDNQDLKESFGKMNDISKKATEVKDIQRIKEISDVIVKDISLNNKIVLNNVNGALEFINSKLLDVYQNDKIYTSVTIPIVGEEYSLISNLTLIYDQNNDIVSYTESLITKNAENKFVIKNYFEGELVENTVTDLDFVNDDELKRGLEHLQGINLQRGRGVGEVAACIAAILGVDLVVAYLIAGTCGVSCPAVVPICVACIGAAATLGAANIAGVIACFNLM